MVAIFVVASILLTYGGLSMPYGIVKVDNLEHQ